jgi:hypothetical protein
MFAKPKRVLTKKDKIKNACAEENKVRSADAIKAVTMRLIKQEDVETRVVVFSAPIVYIPAADNIVITLPASTVDNIGITCHISPHPHSR